MSESRIDTEAGTATAPGSSAVDGANRRATVGAAVAGIVVVVALGGLPLSGFALFAALGAALASLLLAGVLILYWVYDQLVGIDKLKLG